MKNFKSDRHPSGQAAIELAIGGSILLVNGFLALHLALTALSWVLAKHFSYETAVCLEKGEAMNICRKITLNQVQRVSPWIQSPKLYSSMDAKSINCKFSWIPNFMHSGDRRFSYEISILRKDFYKGQI